MHCSPQTRSVAIQSTSRSRKKSQARMLMSLVWFMTSLQSCPLGAIVSFSGSEAILDLNGTSVQLKRNARSIASLHGPGNFEP